MNVQSSKLNETLPETNDEDEVHKYYEPYNPDLENFPDYLNQDIIFEEDNPEEQSQNNADEPMISYDYQNEMACSLKNTVKSIFDLMGKDYCQVQYNINFNLSETYIEQLPAFNYFSYKKDYQTQNDELTVSALNIDTANNI